MLTTVTAKVRDIKTGGVTKTLVFTLSDPRFTVKDITGLGPVKSEVSFGNRTSGAGGVYLSSHTPQRNIVMTIGFQPQYSTNETVDDLRHILYNMYMPETLVDLEFVDDVKGTYLISGVVESHEPLMFSAEPEVVISILCAYPYFKKVESPTVYNVPDTSEFTLNFPGLIPVGFVFNAVCDFDPGSPQMTLTHEQSARGFFGFTSGFNIANGDEIEFSSVDGDRYAKYIRSAATNRLEGYLIGSLVDMRLYPGNNYLKFLYRNSFSTMTITYQPVYGGM